MLGAFKMLKKYQKTLQYFVVGMLILKFQPCFGQLSWTIYDSLNTNQDIPVNNIYSVAVATNGDKWIGTREKYNETILAAVIKFDGQNWINQNLPLSRFQPTDLNNRVWIIFVDSQNNIWAGTHGDGLFKFDGAIWTNITMIDGLGGDYVRDIVEDAQGNLWFGCGPAPDTYPPGIGGLCKYDGSTFTTFLSDTSGGQYVGGGNSGLADNYVYALTIDLQGNIWAGTKGNGISMLNPSGQFTNYNSANSGLIADVVNAGAADTDLNNYVRMGFGQANNVGAAIFTGNNWSHINAMLGTRIRDIVHDNHGNVWFGDKNIDETASSGLWKYDGSNYNIFNTSSGMASNIVNMIAVDHQNGEIWVAGGEGVSVLSGAIPVGFENEEPAPFENFYLSQNYPNPFNPVTLIQYSLNKTQHIQLNIYDLNGRVIRPLVTSVKLAGVHTVQWDGRDKHGHPVSSGIYLYRLIAEDGHQITKKAILVK
jgi:ligand-binding sensor domain-containing protein